MELIIIVMERNMLVNEKMINNMEKARRYGRMELNILVIMLTEKRKDLVFSCESMDPITKANSFKIVSMGQESIPGLMVDHLLEVGNTIKWMEKVSLNGRMGGDMKVSTSRIKNKAMDSLSGRMDANIMDNG